MKTIQSFEKYRGYASAYIRFAALPEVSEIEEFQERGLIRFKINLKEDSFYLVVVSDAKVIPFSREVKQTQYFFRKEFNYLIDRISDYLNGFPAIYHCLVMPTDNVYFGVLRDRKG
jgi:hypothetical protein